MARMGTFWGWAGLFLLAALLALALAPAHAQSCSQTGQICSGPPLSNTEGGSLGVCSCPAVISGNACDCLVSATNSLLVWG